MKLFLKKLLLLGFWILLSFTLSADAGNTAAYGALMPLGPSFMAGDYVSYGFWSNDIELYMLLYWFIGLATFLSNRKLIVLYISVLIFAQIMFIETVNDELLTLTGYMILIPVELSYLMASYFLLGKYQPCEHKAIKTTANDQYLRTD
ncbi:hypothetical protein L2719_16250 [Shewanella schlegeliana]|uniref:Uncharacterized protein n=1 Tax=Shewanella schlegeliana TaxID=190308 RepID=A0ABS1T0J6_9GAMM|nr:hypothetical protein [Shewanella schlegeliana]MBL4913071.1 hypothetical protein [Shewanella schlegeliana]MCL1111085.1 hypothetical protein [Shewanella schlegeliana]